MLEEVGQVDIVTAGRAGAEPLRVADDHVIGVALGVELGEGLGLEIRPRRRLDGDLGAGFLLILVDEFLKVVRRVPFRPEYGQFFRAGGVDRNAARQSHAETGQQAG